MDSISVTLVVFFEEPFYVGVIERVCGGELTACRHVFGAEPRDAEVHADILAEYGPSSDTRTGSKRNGAGDGPFSMPRQDVHASLPGTEAGKPASPRLARNGPCSCAADSC